MQSHSQATPAQLGELQRITAQMPWFADAQILLLKALKQHDRSAFRERLPLLSLYATHRPLLMERLQTAAR